MNYEFISFSIRGMSLDDVLREIHVAVNIVVGIEGADERFQIVNPNIDFVIRGFTSYDELSADVKAKAAQWVVDNYPNT